MQSDQAPDAALQRAAARRQILSVHSSDGRSRFPAADEVPRGARQGGRLFRALRLGRRRQPHADHVAEGVSAALMQRQRLLEPDAAVPALSDQALQRALRGAHRARALCRVARPGKGVSRRAQRRCAAAPCRRDGACLGSARFRGSGPDPRPYPRPVIGAGAPGHSCRRHRRCRYHRGLSGRRADLRPGVLFPGRPELGQPRLFSAA